MIIGVIVGYIVSVAVVLIGILITWSVLGFEAARAALTASAGSLKLATGSEVPANEHDDYADFQPAKWEGWPSYKDGERPYRA